MRPGRPQPRRSGLPPRSVPAGGYGSARQPVKPKKDRRITVAIIAGAAVVFLVLGMMVNPSHSEVHSFTSASDYNQQKDSGCTNSGNGCHGSESSYKDFNTYHPNSECTDCHDYQGFACIPCHAPNKNHECQMCHDGSMKKAPDVVRLTDSYPNGHYRETTHTAIATDMSQTMRATEAGAAGATCKDCHSRDLRKAHTSVPVIAGSSYGDTLGCGECHNDTRASGQKPVVVYVDKRGADLRPDLARKKRTALDERVCRERGGQDAQKL